MNDSDRTGGSPSRAVHAACALFEDAWRAGECPRIERYLEVVVDEERGRLLGALLEREIRLLRATGAAPSAEEYRERFPLHDALVDDVFARVPVDESAGRDLSGEWSEAGSAYDASQSATGASRSVGVGGVTERPARFGRYTVVDVLGEGGFGTVYLARDTQLEREVAIKVSRRSLEGSPVVNDSLLDESRRLARLNHPGIVTVHDVGFQDGRLYVVSEFVRGMHLGTRLAAQRPDWREAADIVAKVAEALAYAHSQSTVHRDVKPRNVILTEGGTPVLVDFGLALTDRDQPRHKHGRLEGTPSYMSPEQVLGQGHRIDGRTDIYSLGVVLYELLCGQRPFRAEDREQLLAQIVEDEPQPPRQLVQGIPPELERICLKAMAKSIHDRYTTATDMAEALRLVLSLHAEPAPALERAPAAEEDTGAGSTSVSSASRRAERRQLTVMFCDLVGSTELSEQIDPEDLRDLLRAYQDTCMSVVERYGGSVSRAYGDGLLIYFGYPVAHEDAAQRAVRAGLKLVEAVAGLQVNIPGQGSRAMAVRIGVHTGLVVVGGIRPDDTLDPMAVTGETPNVAARLQGLAAPGGVVVSAATRQLARDACEFRSLGMHAIKGLSRDVEVYEVLREVEDSATGSIALPGRPVLGRDHELGLLLDRWRQVQSGAGQVALLCGEPGVGKSRLLRLLDERLAVEAHTRLECRCSDFHRNSALYPVTDLVQRILALQPEDTPEARLAKLESLLEQLSLDPAHAVPLIAPLLSLPTGDRYAVAELTPQRRKALTLEALLALFEAMAEEKPLLFVVEDLHWVDPSTLELLGQLVERGPYSPMLVVCTFRPEFVPPWPMRGHVFQLTLGRLTPDQVRELAVAVADGRDLPEEVVEHVVAKTDGVPLFVEELTKSLLESGVLTEEQGKYRLSRPLAAVAIPSTLHDSLMARLDRLGEAKETAQLAATIGREFSQSLLHASSSLDPAVVDTHMARLLAAELAYQRGLSPRARYVFKHALVRDAAYGSLLRDDRRANHRRIAEVLEGDRGMGGVAQPELLAHHFTEAGIAEKAGSYRLEAGQRAVQRSAVQEAIEQLSKGLAAVGAISEPAKRAGLELRLQTTLAMPLAAAKGYTAPEVEQTLERGRELSQQLGDADQLFAVLHGLCKFYEARGEHETVEEIGRQLLAIAKESDDVSQLMEAHRTLGLTLCLMGEFQASCEHTDAALAIYDPDKHRSHAYLYAVDPAAVCLSFSAWALWYLGHPDRALERTQRALALVAELGHPYSEAFAYATAATHYQLRREPQAASESADRAIALATEHAFPFWLGWATMPKGWALGAQGAVAEGSALIERGLAGYRSAGVAAGRALFLATLAEARAREGRVEEALAAVEEGLEHTRGKRDMSLAELHRTKGELLGSCGAGRVLGADACLEASREVAARQGAKALELRAVLARARLHRGGDGENAAREELASVLGHFSEGLDTADLTEAREVVGCKS